MLKTSTRDDGLVINKMEVTNMDGDHVDTEKGITHWYEQAKGLSY